MRDEREGKKNTQISQLLVALMLLLNKRPAGDRRTPELQGRSEVQERGRQSYRGRGKEWGEEKKRREKKRGEG
jgi:hypothetical protein